jgi:hypothetical protein
MKNQLWPGNGDPLWIAVFVFDLIDTFPKESSGPRAAA